MPRYHDTESKKMLGKHHKVIKARAEHLKEHHVSPERLGQSHYDSMDNRKRVEVEDGHMIQEDHSAMANLPQNVIIKTYPSDPGATYPHLDDTMSNVDSQNKHDASKFKKEKNPSKY